MDKITRIKKTRIKRTINIFGGMRLLFVALMIFPIIEIVQERDGAETSSLYVKPVFAQVRATEAVPVKDEAATHSSHDGTLINNLRERQKQLDNREQALKEDERKIEVLKKEVVEKIEALRALEEKMSPALDAKKAEKDKKYRALAKMYEATPNEKAAIIFEKMDRKMAAEIMLRMNSKKAGAVWAEIDHNIGVDIVREVTASQSVNATSAAKIAKEITGVEVARPETSEKLGTEGTTKTGKDITAPEMTKTEIAKRVAAEGATKTAKENTVASVIKSEASQRVTARGVSKDEPKSDGSKRVKSKIDQSSVKKQKPFAIQIKAVRDQAAAKEYAKMLKEERIDAYLSALHAKGKETLYRILVGHFFSHEEALKYMKNNRIESNYPGSFIYKSEQVHPKKKKKRN